jgi:LDH2 family malate/lactate/ureidoglycolate dehydrogenase
VASIGTSPIAIGIPGPGPQDAPLVLDMATSVAECLTGILAGTPIIAPLASASGAKAAIQNAMIIVFNIANFRSLTDYRRDIQQLKEVVKALPRRDGFSELLLPGERGDREAELRRRTGIPLPVQLWTELGSLAQQLGISQLRPSYSPAVRGFRTTRLRWRHRRCNRSRRLIRTN